MAEDAANQPKPEPPDLLRSVMNAYKEVRSRDPLLRAGIGRDWVCVISPALVYPLLREFEQLDGFSEIFMGMGQQGKLRAITGREVWIVNAAPTDSVAYMPISELFRRYGESLSASDRSALEAMQDQKS